MLFYPKCRPAYIISVICLCLHMLCDLSLASNTCPNPPQDDESARKGLGRRNFLKSMRHEINLYGGALATELMGTSPLAGITYGYHFNEDLALEIGFAYTRHNSQMSKTIRDFTGYTFIKQHDARIYTGNLVFHPFHGKFMFFNKTVLHFDFYLLAGAGTTDSHYDKGLTYNAGVGIKIFCNSWLSIRMEVRDFIHAQQLLSTQVVSNDLSMTVGVGFWLPTASIDQL